MRIAILVTNTDESEFAARHPRDGAKFTALLAPLRPDWQFTAFAVAQGEWPADAGAFDGYVITGSPASVHDHDPWVARLLGLIRQIVADRIPLFGACFGHQAIALALGGQVGDNPGGWVLGLTATQHTGGWAGAGEMALYAAHREQVTMPPPGARVLGGSADCPVGSFAVGDTVFTTQYHPEMTPGFIAALVEELAGRLPPDVIARARASLAGQAESTRFAAGIVAFFEGGRAD